MKNILRNLYSNTCIIALCTGLIATTTTAHAQVGGLLALEGSKATKGDFGGAAKAWIPFGGFGFYVEGGFNHDNPFVDLGVGARMMLGNVGLGGLITVGMQEGTHTGKNFYNLKPSFEVGFGGFTVGTTISVPLGKKERTIVNSGSAQEEFRNKPASTKCTNPTNTDDRLCDLWLVGRTDSTERNSLGVHVHARYDVNLGMITLSPTGGVYVYGRDGKDLVGVHGGVQLAANFGGGISLSAGAHLRHHNSNKAYQDDHRTQGVFTVGLSWNFGGQDVMEPAGFVDKAPNRTVFERGLMTQRKQGQSYEGRAGLSNSNVNTTVSDVIFIDATSVNPHTRIINMTDGQMVIVSGTVNMANNMVDIGANNVFVVGGGSQLGIRTLDGRSGIFTAPGTRPTINGGNVAAVFRANGRHNVIFQGLDIVGNGINTLRGIHIFNNSDYAQIDDVSIENVTLHAIHIQQNNHNSTINNVRIKNAGAANQGVIKVENDVSNLKIRNVTMRNLATNSIGLQLTNDVDSTTVSGLDIDDADANYQSAVRIDNNSDGNVIEHSMFKNFATNGIVIDGDSSDTNELRYLTLVTSATTNGHGILLSNGPDGITLTNITVIGRGAANFRALQVNDGAVNIRVGNFHAENWENGFFLQDAGTTIIDLGGNTFTANGMQTSCGSAANVVGGLNVTTTNNGTVDLCR